MGVLRKTNNFVEQNPKKRSGLQAISYYRDRIMRSRATRALVSHPRYVLLGIIVAALLLEIIENIFVSRFGSGVYQIFDGLVILLVLPVMGWFMVSLLESTENERKLAARDDNLRSEFSQKLGDAKNWDELVHRLVEYPHLVAPNAQITLYVYKRENSTPQAEAACSPEGIITLRPVITDNPGTLPVGSLPQLLTQVGGPAYNATTSPATVTPGGGKQAKAADSSLLPNRFDLPVTRNEQTIGVLTLEYPRRSRPSPGEIRALKNAAPVMALALEGALLQNLAIEQAAASESQRQEIAQVLHDTLAQNISYLRLKLDQLTGENAIREIGAVLQELERMRATADEAYQQVRSTLDQLAPPHTEDLMTMLTRQAAVISERSGLVLRSSLLGTPYPLPAMLRQQILYIAREALHNIEKHAGAREIRMQFLWLEHEMILKISDDGIGFDPLSVPSEGHYGLWIMQQRAQEIGGTLQVAPLKECASPEQPGGPERPGGPEQPGSGQCGTEITLWVPRPVFPTAGAD